MPTSTINLYKPHEVKNIIVGSDFFALIEAINLGIDQEGVDQEGKKKYSPPKTLLIQPYLERKYEYQNDPSVKNKSILAHSFVNRLLEGYNSENEEIKAIIQKQNKHDDGAGLTAGDLTALLKYDSFIEHLFKDCNDTKKIVEDVKNDKAGKSWGDLLAYLTGIAQYHGALIDPLYNISNVENDIRKKYKNVQNVVNPLKISQAPENDDVQTIVVGAGPIGLLNAIGLLHKKPDMKLVILEKYDEYKRNHTLMVDYRQIKKFLDASANPNPDPAIAELVKRTKKNKYIRISEIEHLLKNRAVELGAHLITGHGVRDVEEEVFKKYKNANLIIGADGTRSVVSHQVIGLDKILQYNVVAADNPPVNLADKTIYVSVWQGEQEKGGKQEEVRKIQYSMKTAEGKEVRNVITDIAVYEDFDIYNLDKTHIKEIQTAAARNYHADGNGNKKEFDFVLQFRFEIEGEAPAIPLPTLVRFMQNYGLTCDEYVGKTDALGKTPITFQMMISKDHYQILEKFAKSGNPIKPFSESDETRMGQVPEILMQQLKGYLGLRLRHFTGEDDIVGLDKATISVNEAPATYAKEVYKKIDGRHVLLAGDAALGLSYFKGINAGFEASARVFPSLLKEDNVRKTGLEQHQKWFESTYAPQKVNEVKNYSTYRIRLLVAFFKTLQFIFRSDLLMRGETAEKTVDLYLGHLKAVRAEQEQEEPFIPKKRPIFKILWASITRASAYPSIFRYSELKSEAFFYGSEIKEESPTSNLPKWTHAYEHNGQLLESVLTFRPKNSWIIIREIGKNIKEAFKPYKSAYYVARDLAMPLRALYNLIAGGALIITALPVELFNGVYGLLLPAKHENRWSNLAISAIAFFSRLLEGVSRLILAANLTVSTVLLPFKVASRSISTLVRYVCESLLLESNKRIKSLVRQGSSLLPNDIEKSPNPTVDQEIEVVTVDKTNSDNIPNAAKKLSSIAVDLHAHYEKYISRHQKSNISVKEEKLAYQKCLSRGNMTSYQDYFGLFKPKTPITAEEESLESENDSSAQKKQAK